MFNENLKTIRKAKGYTQEELSNQNSCSKTNYQQMGKRTIRTRCRYIIQISGCIRD